MRMYDAAITGTNVVYTTSSVNQPTGGIAVDHPAQATIYAKRGKISVLIPFEFTIIPLTQNSIEPEVQQRSNAPMSGSISSQPNSNYYRTNQNVYRPVYYQTSSYPWNNYNNRGFYIPATPSVSSSYQPFNQPAQQYQNGYRPILYQQQLPANTYRSQYYSPNSNVVYAPSYQQQPLRRTEVRPWPQYNRPVGKQINYLFFLAGNATLTHLFIFNTKDRPNQPQQQQQVPLPNWSATNTKPININEINSTHPPNTTTIPAPSNSNNNQTTSIVANSTIPATANTGTAPTTKETIQTTKEQPAIPAVPANTAMDTSNLNNSTDDSQKEKAKPIDGEQVAVNQHGETNLDKKDSSPEVKSSAPQNSGETSGSGKVDNPESSHADTAPASIDSNNMVEKAENPSHEQASVAT